MSEVDADVSDRFTGVLGGGMALTQAVAFAAVGYLVLESLAYGIVAGAFTGFGSFLFLPWFLGLQTTGEELGEEISLTEAAERVDRSTQLGVLGLGFDMGGVIMITVGFALDEVNLLLGTGAAVANVLVIYLIGAVLLDL